MDVLKYSLIHTFSFCRVWCTWPHYLWRKIEVALMCAMKLFNLWDQVDGFSDFKHSNNRYFVVSTYCMNKIIPKRADEYHLGEIYFFGFETPWNWWPKAYGHYIETVVLQRRWISFNKFYIEDSSATSVDLLSSSQIESCTRLNLSVPSICCI